MTLTSGKEFHSHSGYVAHDELIGIDEGTTIRSTRGATYTVLRPTLSDFVLKMPRGAQVIYPKDLGPLLMLADIAPGIRVLESRVSAPARSRWRCCAPARTSSATSCARTSHPRATANVERFLGPEVMARYRVELRDAYEGIDEGELDRIVLDLPEPWQVVPAAVDALRPGGIFVAYSPSIVQVMQLRDAFEKAGTFALCETVEVLNRGWHVEGQAVRPDHRMVAHTGFLTSARRVVT